MIQNNGNHFILENAFLRREIEIGDFGVRTTSFIHKMTGREYLHAPCREFAFSIDRNYITSIQKAQYQSVDGTILKGDGALEFLGSNREEAGKEAEELVLTFRAGKVEVSLHYRIYHKIAGMRKFLTFRTEEEEELLLENLVFDDTLLTPGGIPAECDFYMGNAFTPAPVSFTLEGTEDLVVAYHAAYEEGVLTATTAPGPLRYLMCYPDWNNLINACSMSNAPFAKYLKKGEVFTSPSSLIAFGRGKLSSGSFPEEMRKLIRAGLPAFTGKEEVVFCTWPGYALNVSEKLLYDLADQAAELGIGCILLDIGWFPWGSDRSGRERKPDPEKFPNGLEAVSEYLHKKGIRFGLWVNIGHDCGDPLPDGLYDALQADGTPKRLGWNYSTAFRTKCFASNYREVILRQTDEIAKKYQVDLFKFDASSILSPYGVLPLGCHGKDHAFHHGFQDSIPEMFAGFRFLREELKKRNPSLQIDFSFESFGCERPSIGALEYSDLNHLTNHAGKDPAIHNLRRIRRNFYRQTGALPPERLMHGLVSIHGEDAAEVLLTSFVGAPLISGDLLQLPEKEKCRMKKLLSSFRKAVEEGPLTSFELLSDTEEMDAFRRYSEKGAEILCVFNYGKRPVEIQRNDLLDGENGLPGGIVPPESCKMFWKKGL